MANNWSAGHFSTGCKDERRREGVGSEERTEMICLARPSRCMKIEGTKKLGGWRGEESGLHLEKTLTSSILEYLMQSDTTILPAC